MRTDIVPGSIFPDYELPDHTTKRRKLSAVDSLEHPPAQSAFEQKSSKSRANGDGFEGENQVMKAG